MLFWFCIFLFDFRAGSFVVLVGIRHYYCLYFVVGQPGLAVECNPLVLVLKQLMMMMIRTNVCVFIVLLCSKTFSRLRAYSYGERVSARNSSAIFSLCMCAVNMSQTHSSSRSPQSVHDAISSKSA